MGLVILAARRQLASSIPREWQYVLVFQKHTTLLTLKSINAAWTTTMHCSLACTTGNRVRGSVQGAGVFDVAWCD
jgi:hypothetical protein